MKKKNPNGFIIKEKVIKKFRNAINGIIEGFKIENTLKFHLLMGIIVIVVSIILKLNEIEFVIIILLIGLVITTEMINTVFEIMAKIVKDGYDEKIKVALDISAAAVLITSIIAIIVGGIILTPKILKFFLNIFG